MLQYLLFAFALRMTIINPLKIDIITLFPEVFPGPLHLSIIKRAVENKKCIINTLNLRDFAYDKHKSVDDVVYGGGAGMLLRPDVLGKAIESVLTENTKCILLTPSGQLFEQKKAVELISYKHLIIICGRFEGVDYRVIEEYNIEEICIGNYVLSGGELAAMILLDTCIRLIPEVVNDESLHQESFSNELNGMCEYTQYTRPSIWKERSVPDVLLSGNHKKIASWRMQNARQITHKNRPDLLKNDDAA